MKRVLPLLVGLAVLVATGVVHGLWTERWRGSPARDAAAERLALLPDHLPGWTSKEIPQDPDAMKVAGAVGHWARLFTDEVTGEPVEVLLLCGRPGNMAVHRPEDCFRAAGFELTAKPDHCKIAPPAGGSGEFWTGVFAKPGVSGPVRLRIFWSWDAGGGWQAPESTRLAFLRKEYVYKLYVLRALAGPPGPLTEDPCVALLVQLLPVLGRTLAPASP